jgi:hypothetical protein
VHNRQSPTDHLVPFIDDDSDLLVELVPSVREHTFNKMPLDGISSDVDRPTSSSAAYHASPFQSIEHDYAWAGVFPTDDQSTCTASLRYLKCFYPELFILQWIKR